MVFPRTPELASSPTGYFWNARVYDSPRPRPAYAAHAATIAVRKTTNKVHNKKLRRRREGLLTKAYEYGELDGVELACSFAIQSAGSFTITHLGKSCPGSETWKKWQASYRILWQARFLIEIDGTSQGEERVHRKREGKSGGDATKAEEAEECVFMERGGQ